MIERGIEEGGGCVDIASVSKSAPRRRLVVRNVGLRHARKKESTQDNTTENTRPGPYTEQDTKCVQDVNATLTHKNSTAIVVAENSELNREPITGITATKTKGRRTGNGKGRGQGSTEEEEEEEKYSYHFQCYNCLTLHEGTIKSDNQLLEIECKELITWNPEVNAPDLFFLLGKPQVCGRVNHVYGRRRRIRAKK